MIANLIGGFVSILVGTSLIGPIATEVSTYSASTNSTGTTCTTYDQAGCENAQLYLAASWGATVLKMVPGFFAIAILGVGIAVTYTSLRQAGIV